jgi:hypothetical protein
LLSRVVQSLLDSCPCVLDGGLSLIDATCRLLRDLSEAGSLSVNLTDGNLSALS